MSEQAPEPVQQSDRTDGEAAPDDPTAERAQEGVQEAFE
jgi:hypothetical protein